VQTGMLTLDSRFLSHSTMDVAWPLLLSHLFADPLPQQNRINPLGIEAKNVCNISQLYQ
jgi:hypothetical protein